MRPQTHLGRAGLCLAVACAAFACDTAADDTSLDIDLYTATGQEALLDGTGADIIELVVINASDPFGTQTKEEVQISAGQGTVTALPVGEGYQLFARGYRGSESTPRFYGASLPFGVAAGSAQKVAVQVGQVDCVGLNRSSSLRVPEGKDDMVNLRAGMTMTALPDGRILVIGGATVDGQGNVATVHNTMEVYDPNRGQFQTLDAQLRVPRAYHSATVLASGQVLVVGGVTAGSGGAVTATGSASIIDITATTGNVVQALPDAFEGGTGRYGHEAILLSDSARSVLISGGVTADGATPVSTFRYFPFETGDETAGTFVRQGDVRLGGRGLASAPLARTSELAVVSGGLTADGVVSDSVEIFTVNPGQPGCTNPDQVPGAKLGCFIRPTNRRLAEPRWGHRALAVDDGRQVVFVGGFGDPDAEEQPAGVEMMDSRLEMRSGAEVGALRFPRGELSATRLPDDSVLLLGGRRGDTPMLVSTRLQPRRGQGTDGTEVVLGYGLVELADGCEMSEPRYGHQATLTAAGTVLVGGGLTAVNGSPTPSRRAELYFPQVVKIETYYPR